MRYLLLILLFVSGCKKPEGPERSADRADMELRTFLGIRTLDGSFVLPDSATAYYPVTVLFAEGKEMAEIKGPVMMTVGPHREQPFTGRIQFLLQSGSGRSTRAALVDGPNMKDLSAEFPHWDHLDYAAWRSVGMEEGLSYHGMSVLGLLVSSTTSPQLYPTSQTIPTAGTYVVAIGIVYGSDSEALKARFLSK